MERIRTHEGLWLEKPAKFNVRPEPIRARRAIMDEFDNLIGYTKKTNEGYEIDYLDEMGKVKQKLVGSFERLQSFLEENAYAPAVQMEEMVEFRTYLPTRVYLYTTRDHLHALGNILCLDGRTLALWWDGKQARHRSFEPGQKGIGQAHDVITTTVGLPE